MKKKLFLSEDFKNLKSGMELTVKESSEIKGGAAAGCLFCKTGCYYGGCVTCTGCYIKGCVSYNNGGGTA